MMTCTHLFRLLLVSLLVIGTGGSVFGDLEEIRQYPAEALAYDSIEMAILQLEWRLKQGSAEKVALEERMEALRRESKVITEKAEAIGERLPPRLRFAGVQLRAKLTGRCLEELLSVELELATTREMSDRAREFSAEIEREQADQQRQAAAVQLAGLRRQYHFQEEGLEQARQQVAGGLIHSNVVLEKEAEISQLRAQLELLELQMKQLESRKELSAAKEISEFNIKVKSLEARKAAIESFLDKLTQAAQFERELQQVMRADEIAREREHRLAVRIDEVEMQMVETDAFLNLLLKETAQRREEAESKSDEGDQPIGEEDGSDGSP